jgi:hypothetical protein
MIDAKYSELERFARDNYEAGGHWVYECFDSEDYAEYLAEAGGDMGRAKAALRKYWQLLVEQERECAWDGPSETRD